VATEVEVREGNKADEWLVLDAFVPSQWADRYRKQVKDDPYKRLALSVLEDSISVLSTAMRENGADIRQQSQYKKWANKEREMRWLFEPNLTGYSLELVCASLDIDVDWLRESLRKVLDRITYQKERRVVVSSSPT